MQLHAIVGLVVLAGLYGPQNLGDPAQRLAELEQRFTEERTSWEEFRKQAKTLAQRAEVNAAFPGRDFAEEYEAIAREAAKGETAARAWYGVFRIGFLVEDKELFARGLERVLSEHMDSSVIGSVLGALAYGAPDWTLPAAQDALREILARTTSKDLRVEALVELAMLVGLDPALGEKGRAEAEELLQRLEREHGDEELNAMNGREFVTGARYEITKLGLGMVAPEFEIKDQEGATFKLSDYRGQVVVLDFWGFV
jgi:hypothetical protein